MATIKQRGNSISVVYYYNDNGKLRQKWERCATMKEAEKRKAEVEYKISQNTFIPPSPKTVEELMKDFVELYGKKKWGVSMYATNTALIRNYINPLIGNMKLQKITTLAVAQYIKQLGLTRPVVAGRKATSYRNEYLSPSMVEKIIKLCQCAFGQAVYWELIAKNPFKGAVLDKVEKKKRAIWQASDIQRALTDCEDSRLFIAINLAFACSLRLGEILGLTWDCVDISDRAIANDNASLQVEKELARVSSIAMEALEDKDIIRTFPTSMKNAKTRLVLKKPKTDSSIRKVWIPKTVAYYLREWKEQQKLTVDFLGEEACENYGLVITLKDGRPCENKLIEKAFECLKESAGLPDVVFHSLRHSSTTYKLKLNHGDLKATQGDTGHAQIDMITDIYAHIVDEDRKVNAQKFEAAFYSPEAMKKVNAGEVKETAAIDFDTLVNQLKENPALAAQLASVLMSSAKN